MRLPIYAGIAIYPPGAAASADIATSAQKSEAKTFQKKIKNYFLDLL